MGFSMSTFIATLGFDAQADYLHTAKNSILFASVVSAILGLVFYAFSAEKMINR
jgi:Na+:H+ antiporter, NhaA family